MRELFRTVVNDGDISEVTESRLRGLRGASGFVISARVEVGRSTNGFGRSNDI